MQTHRARSLCGWSLFVILAGPSWCLCAGQKPAEEPSPPAHLTVHEWGTFLSMQGSDGIPLGGMVDSDEVLPPFVHERALDGLSRSMYRSKMETPVTYFYADRPMTVDVRVDMHHGLLTHWFPAVRYFEPSVAAQRAARNKDGDSLLDWHNVQLLPTSGNTKPSFPAVGNDSIWRFARQTDSTVVRINRGSAKSPAYVDEKFLFYRGLGLFTLPLQVRSTTDTTETRLILRNGGKNPIPAAFAIEVDRGNIRFMALPPLMPGASSRTAMSSFVPATRLDPGVTRAKAAVAAALVQVGLYPKEARAMTDTWERSYFRTEGLRVLYVLPRANVDEVIPIRIRPAPEHLVRVMVGRVEVMTPALARRLEKAVADLDSPSAATRKTAQNELARLGRFQEPALHRVAAMTKLASVRERAERLLQKRVARP